MKLYHQNFMLKEVDGQESWYDVLHSDEPEKWQDSVMWVRLLDVSLLIDTFSLHTHKELLFKLE